MSSRSHSRAALVAALVLAAGGALAQGLDTQGPTARALDKVRVCADPNNLPFSNDAGEGFENRIAELLAHDLGVPLEYAGGRSGAALSATRCAPAIATSSSGCRRATS